MLATSIIGEHEAFSNGARLVSHTTIVLLRGINVGGNNMIKMADLRRVLEAGGFTEVKTLLQSGNVVVTSDLEPRDVEKKISHILATDLNKTVDVFALDTGTWRRLIEANPFPHEAVDDPSHLVLIVSRQAPSAEAVDAVRSANSGPERFELAQGCLYVFYPEGIGDSKLPKVPGWNKLAASGTARNWNTVLKLAELAGA